MPAASYSQGSGFDSLREHHNDLPVRLVGDKTPSADVRQLLPLMLDTTGLFQDRKSPAASDIADTGRFRRFSRPRAVANQWLAASYQSLGLAKRTNPR